MAQVIIPTPLRKFTQNQASLNTTGTTVQEAIENITTEFPQLKSNILDDDGSIRGFIRIYVGEDDIVTLQQGNTPIKEDTVISIIPAIAGGSL